LLTVATISTPKPVDISKVRSIDGKKKVKGRESERGRDDMSTSKTRTQANLCPRPLSREPPAPDLQAG
jgi:hypothetical protein